MPIASATLLLCTVLTVQDGDTLRARCPTDGARPAVVTVRLHAIDAPERAQPYGRRARQALSALVARRPVELRCVDTDAYARHVCQVKVAPVESPDAPASIDAGLALVHDGLAWWYRQFSDAQTPAERSHYEHAEQEARARRVGLWRDARHAQPPWQWRRTHPRLQDPQRPS